MFNVNNPYFYPGWLGNGQRPNANNNALTQYQMLQVMLHQIEVLEAKVEDLEAIVYAGVEDEI